MRLLQRFRATSVATSVATVATDPARPGSVEREERFLELFELCQEQGLIPRTSRPAVYSMFYMLGQGRLH